MMSFWEIFLRIFASANKGKNRHALIVDINKAIDRGIQFEGVEQLVLKFSGNIRVVENPGFCYGRGKHQFA